MEPGKLFQVSQGLRVLVRDEGEKTYVAFEVDGVTFYLKADKWKDFRLAIYEIDREFIKRYRNLDTHSEKSSDRSEVKTI